jgi:SAM-dependent methyltransferase
MPNFDPKRVFGPRVEAYVQYRPGYPGAVVETLARDCGLTSSWRIADMGCGTGLLARLFLDFGCAVSGLEPNEEMRLAGEQILAGYPGFTSLAGSAEDSGLANGSIDLVCAGMAFHWFDVARAKVEFGRILTPTGWVALVWNRMLPGPEPFMRDYCGLILETSPGWTETLRRDTPESGLDLPGFFEGSYQRAVFPHQQSFDWEGLRGRTLSIAHVPQPDAPAHPVLFARLRELYERYQSNGLVTVQYETELYYGNRHA